MPSWDDVEVGDTITWSRTGVVTNIESVDGVVVDYRVEIAGENRLLFPDRTTLKSVEKPVRTFKPGDRVRSKTTHHEYTLGSNGYFDHQNASVYHPPWYKAPADTDGVFAYDAYELVED